MKKWQKIVCIFIMMSVICGCTRVRSKYTAFKTWISETINEVFSTDFYTSTGGWDYRRVPLIAPYELLSLNHGKDWNCCKRDNINVFGGPLLETSKRSIEYAGITDSTIYLSYTEDLDELCDFGDPEWQKRQYAIIDVPTDSVEWHETKEDWLSALEKRNIMNPQLHRVDSLYEDFANHKQLLFNPPK